MKPPAGAKIRVLLANDIPLFVEGLRCSLEQDSRMAVVGAASDAKGIFRQAKVLEPEVILLDLNIPGLGGLDVLPRLMRVAERSKVIVLATHADGGLVREAARAGAKGYLLVGSTPQVLQRAVAEVHAGRTSFVVPPQEGAEGVGAGLTARERQVLTLVAEGLSSKEIAAELGIGPRTVETHRERLMEKLDARNAVDLVRSAFARGLVRL